MEDPEKSLRLSPELGWWHARDLRDQLQDRNPSVFIWSIGNEINEQWDKKIVLNLPPLRELAAIVRSLDTNKPVTRLSTVLI